jgi:G3E family GTPase
VDEEMDTCLRLDGVVTVVDAKRLGTLLTDPGVYSDVAKQIAYADRVLINKIDIASEEEVWIIMIPCFQTMFHHVVPLLCI